MSFFVSLIDRLYYFLACLGNRYPCTIHDPSSLFKGFLNYSVAGKVNSRPIPLKNMYELVELIEKFSPKEAAFIGFSYAKFIKLYNQSHSVQEDALNRIADYYVKNIGNKNYLKNFFPCKIVNINIEHDGNSEIFFKVMNKAANTRTIIAKDIAKDFLMIKKFSPIESFMISIICGNYIDSIEFQKFTFDKLVFEDC